MGNESRAEEVCEVRGVAEQKLHGQQAHHGRAARDGEAELPLVRVEAHGVRAAGDVGARLQLGLKLRRQLVAAVLPLRQQDLALPLDAGRRVRGVCVFLVEVQRAIVARNRGKRVRNVHLVHHGFILLLHVEGPLQLEREVAEAAIAPEGRIDKDLDWRHRGFMYLRGFLSLRANRRRDPGVVLASSLVSAHDCMLCLVVGAHRAHGPAVHGVRHAQILQSGLSSGEHAAKHRRINIGVLQHLPCAMVRMGKKALCARKPVRQVVLQEFAGHRVFFST